MNLETIAYAGGIGGSIIGLLGGLIGTYVAVKRAGSKAEKKLILKWALIIWLLLCGLIILPLVLSIAGLFPTWGYWPTALVFFILLGPIIRELNKRQIAIRKENRLQGINL
jgi:hypothetical protein